MNPKYTYHKKQVSNSEKQQILKILGNNPSDKHIEFIAHENDIKTRTIRTWLKNKQQFCTENKQTSDSEDNLYNPKRKTKEDKALFDYEKQFNQQSNQYNYEITNSDLLLKNSNHTDSTQLQGVLAIPQVQLQTLMEKNQQKQDKYALQNFESLALLLDQNDEIYQLVSLFQNQERQIENIKKVQQDILEYMCSHLTKKPKRI
ncbi:unnamed protein product [Paramecium sonneborni]|uniref:Uncharacterized protein n=1 Tax=Paramecium sonneborni TaxID=65129 RepID=A0A8S1LM97_9CILI|nr:unnamed protein product [Paramecium sonneborni]